MGRDDGVEVEPGLRRPPLLARAGLDQRELVPRPRPRARRSRRRGGGAAAADARARRALRLLRVLRPVDRRAARQRALLLERGTDARPPARSAELRPEPALSGRRRQRRRGVRRAGRRARAARARRRRDRRARARSPWEELVSGLARRARGLGASSRAVDVRDSFGAVGRDRTAHGRGRAPRRSRLRPPLRRIARELLRRASARPRATGRRRRSSSGPAARSSPTTRSGTPTFRSGSRLAAVQAGQRRQRRPAGRRAADPSSGCSSSTGRCSTGTSRRSRRRLDRYVDLDRPRCAALARRATRCGARSQRSPPRRSGPGRRSCPARGAVSGCAACSASQTDAPNLAWSYELITPESGRPARRRPNRSRSASSC